MKPWILKKLQTAGTRNSAVRNSIISAIVARDCSLFHTGELIDALPNIDRVTVYRTFDLLASLDIIHPVMQRDGVQYYELHGPDHHHHAMCTGCTSQECVECELPESTNKHHSLFYSYTCSNCT